MARISLSSPWNIYVSELEQLFKYDSEVHVIYDEENREVKIYVDSRIPQKIGALAELLPEKKDFGNICLNIRVIPANGKALDKEIFGVFQKGVLFEYAFHANPILSFIKTVKGIFTNDITYVVFANKVVQYFNDDIGDIYGQKSTLYQDIAQRVFGTMEGVFYCTDVEDSDKSYEISHPLGEWP